MAHTVFSFITLNELRDNPVSLLQRTNQPDSRGALEPGVLGVQHGFHHIQREGCPDNKIVTTEYSCAKAGGEKGTCFR
ncbi:UNVERIFIED_CONTAM: hypothetical protein FKN15_029016 [Acipenser sinensis]